MNSSVQLIKTRRFGDERGWFSETWSKTRYTTLGITCPFVQDNQSRSTFVGTIRGIHFQRPPHAQDKLVRCLRGAVLDYAVDLRKDSPTFGRHVVAELTADNGDQLFIPVGFGHAFVTLTPDAEIAYKCSDTYAPDCDGGVLWCDPALGIDWPLPPGGPILSEKDKSLPLLAEFESPFIYNGIPLTAL